MDCEPLKFHRKQIRRTTTRVQNIRDGNANIMWCSSQSAGGRGCTGSCVSTFGRCLGSWPGRRRALLGPWIFCVRGGSRRECDPIHPAAGTAGPPVGPDEDVLPTAATGGSQSIRFERFTFQASSSAGGTWLEPPLTSGHSYHPESSRPLGPGDGYQA